MQTPWNQFWQWSHAIMNAVDDAARPRQMHHSSASAVAAFFRAFLGGGCR